MTDRITSASLLELDAAKLIAKELGDTFELAFLSKSSWTHANGKAVDGSFRDVNAPLQSDYLNAARAVLQASEARGSSTPSPSEDELREVLAKEFARRGMTSSAQAIRDSSLDDKTDKAVLSAMRTILHRTHTSGETELEAASNGRGLR